MSHFQPIFVRPTEARLALSPELTYQPVLISPDPQNLAFQPIIIRPDPNDTTPDDSPGTQAPELPKA